jgi:hypothetical protein
LLLSGVTLAQQPKLKLTWYPFDLDFISTKYSDSAIGELRAKEAHAAKNVHTESCGGNDAELHIGMTLDELGLSSGQMPVSGPVVEGDDGWGGVAELPNGKLADGPSKFAKLSGKAVTFTGFFRVWDEGHAHGAVHPSNPHHVFEVHPAWAFKGTGVSFSRVDLVEPLGLLLTPESTKLIKEHFADAPVPTLNTIRHYLHTEGTDFYGNKVGPLPGGVGYAWPKLGEIREQVFAVTFKTPRGATAEEFVSWYKHGGGMDMRWH